MNFKPDMNAFNFMVSIAKLLLHTHLYNFMDYVTNERMLVTKHNGRLKCTFFSSKLRAIINTLGQCELNVVPCAISRPLMKFTSKVMGCNLGLDIQSKCWNFPKDGYVIHPHLLQCHTMIFRVVTNLDNLSYKAFHFHLTPPR